MTKTINIDDELAGLFKKEQVIAFFEIGEAAAAGSSPISGLCKISKPREGASALSYLGLLFVFDIPSQESWVQINKLMQAFDGPALKHCLKSLDYAVSAPVMNPSADVYIKQIDLVFAKGFTPGTEFIENDLFPAVCGVGGLQHGELIWWQESALQPAEVKTAPAKEPESLFAKLRKMIVSS